MTILKFSAILLLVCVVPRARLFSQTETAVESVLVRQADAWNRGDIRGYMEGYWKSDSLLFTSGGAVRRGWDSTLAKYLRSYRTRAEMGTLSFSGLEIRILSQEAAWVFGRWELVRAQDRPSGVFTLILRKFPGGWKIIHDHTSLEPASQMPAGAGQTQPK